MSVTSPVDENYCVDQSVWNKQFSAMLLRMLIKMGKIRHLSLHGVVGNYLLELDHLIAYNMNCLESLDIKSSEHGFEILVALGIAAREHLQGMKSLSLQVDLHLPSDIEHEVDSTLLVYAHIFCNLDSLILRSYCNTKDISGLISSPTLSKFLYGIAMNHTLQRMTLGDMNLDPKGVSCILQNNHTLHTFNLVFVELTKEMISSLSTGLNKNKSLRNFCLIESQDRKVGLYPSLISFAATTAELSNYQINEMDVMNNRALYKKPYYLLLDSIVNSRLQSVILDFEIGKFFHNSTEFFKHLIRMLIKDKTLTRFTLNQSHFSEEYLAEIARALVINGRINEIDLTLGNSLTPSIYSRASYLPMSELLENIPTVQNHGQELLIQQKVDEFKEIMLKNMLKTFVFILAIRKQKQDRILEQLSFDLFICSILKVLHKRIHRQTVFIDMWKETKIDAKKSAEHSLIHIHSNAA